MKCWNSATMSAKASWKARTSGLVGVEIAAVHAVEQRVRRLVRDDVVREAGEHHAAGNVLGSGGLGGAEVAEQQRDLVRAVVGVRLAERVRIDAEPAHEDRIVLATLARRRRTVPPQAAAAERALEIVDGQAGHGVDHLLVELRLALSRRPARPAPAGWDRRGRPARRSSRWPGRRRSPPGTRRPGRAAAASHGTLKVSSPIIAVASWIVRLGSPL